MKAIPDKEIIHFREKLLDWYRTHKRDLPWRRTGDPYSIWVSEVMLQQTQVVTVIGYYNRFMERFPDIMALAEAELDDVLKLWEGLGYYSRARNFYRAANQIVMCGKGIVPDTPDAFLKLTGVGPYICAAVQSIAFGHPLAVTDGNVKRVLARVFEMSDPVNDASAHGNFSEKATLLLEHSDPSSFNQAMMELGALICRPSSPSCEDCPVAGFCRAYAHGRISDFPKRKKKTPVPVRKRVAALIVKKNRFLIIKRKNDGFLGGLWELPDTSVKRKGDPAHLLETEVLHKTGLTIRAEKSLSVIRHAYTHFKLEMELWVCSLPDSEKRLASSNEMKWIAFEETGGYAFHKAVHKCFELAQKKGIFPEMPSL